MKFPLANAKRAVLLLEMLNEFTELDRRLDTIEGIDREATRAAIPAVKKILQDEIIALGGEDEEPPALQDRVTGGAI